MNPTRRWFLITGLIVVVALVLLATDVIDFTAGTLPLIALVVNLLVGLVVGDYTADKRRKRLAERRAESPVWSPVVDEQR